MKADLGLAIELREAAWHGNMMLAGVHRPPFALHNSHIPFKTCQAAFLQITDPPTGSSQQDKMKQLGQWIVADDAPRKAHFRA